MSPIPPHSPHHNYHNEERRNSGHGDLDMDLANLSIHENNENTVNNATEVDDGSQELVPQITKDLFNLYSLSFVCRSKDLSERRIKLDFGLVAEVARVRGA